MNFLEGITNYIAETYADRLNYFPSNVKTSLLIILFCVIATLEMYVYISFRRLYQANEKRQLDRWNEHVSNMLANLIIFDEADKTEDIVAHFYPKMKKMPLRNKVLNKVLISEILTYHKSFTGQIGEVLSILYRKLGLDKKSKKKINSRKREVKIEGIREANEMRISEMASEIIKYTDDENALLRMESQAAYINLSENDPFRFLDRAQERILDWHQVVLFEIITKNKALKIPSFAQWLRSPNDTVVMLCLKLIEHFMQFEAAEEVERLLKHHNPRIVKKSVEIIGKLELASAETSMFEIYFDQPEDVKLEILNSLGKISSGNYENFLISRIYSGNVKIKKEALYAIKRDQHEGEQKLRELYQQTTVENQALINHVLDSRIKP
ncbi:HEAT repeat domain-containing protein [Pedobacter sp.]